ncbi:MAG: hypothetical protein K2W96_20695 [Gemmataceae bacterium]|nr:hypothetical protein [Gemmataceae bacterium]
MLASLACLLGCALNLTGFGSQKPVRLDEIRHSADQRQTQFKNVRVKYRVHEFVSKQMQADLASPRPPQAPPSPVPVSDLRFTVTAEFTRKGDLARAEHEGPSVAETVLRPSSHPIVSVYNGRRTLRHIDRLYSISAKAKAFSNYATPWDCSGEKAFRAVLDLLDRKKIAEKDIKITEGEQAGEVVLEVVYETKWRNRFWLLREFGYVVKRAEIFNANGFLAYRYHGVEHEIVDGVPYPKKATCSYYKDIGGEAVLYEENRAEVESITTNRSEIPDSLFEMDIPKDAEIFDEDEQKFIRNPERLQRVLDEIAAESPRAVNTRFWNWVWLALAGTVAIVGVLLIWRWRARRPEA